MTLDDFRSNPMGSLPRNVAPRLFTGRPLNPPRRRWTRIHRGARRTRLLYEFRDSFGAVRYGDVTDIAVGFVTLGRELELRAELATDVSQLGR